MTVTDNEPYYKVIRIILNKYDHQKFRELAAKRGKSMMAYLKELALKEISNAKQVS